jgi:hypothetical protein
MEETLGSLTKRISVFELEFGAEPQLVEGVHRSLSLVAYSSKVWTVAMLLNRYVSIFKSRYSSIY